MMRFNLGRRSFLKAAAGTAALAGFSDGLVQTAQAAPKASGAKDDTKIVKTCCRA